MNLLKVRADFAWCELTGDRLVNEFWRQGEGVACVEPVSHETVEKIDKREIRSEQAILQSRTKVLTAPFLQMISVDTSRFADITLLAS